MIYLESYKHCDFKLIPRYKEEEGLSVYVFFFKTVTEAELKRLKEAFKRASTLNGWMTENLFVREVLWDGVPPKLAQVCVLI